MSVANPTQPTQVVNATPQQPVIDTSTWVKPSGTNLVFTDSPNLQAIQRGGDDSTAFMLPNSTRLPPGAQVTNVTYTTDPKTQTTVANISYLTVEQQQQQAQYQTQLANDAAKWEQAGFSQYAGKALYPQLPEGAKIVEVKQTAEGINYSYTAPQQQQPQPQQTQQQPTVEQANTDIARLQVMNQTWKGIQDYSKAVAAKETEFNAMPVQERINAVQNSQYALKDIPAGTEITNVQFSGGQLNFSFGVTQQAITAKEQEFNSLPLEKRVSELQRLMPTALSGITPDQTITDVQYKNGQLNFSLAQQQTQTQKPTQPADFVGPKQGLKAPEGYEITGTHKETLYPLSEANKQLAENYLGLNNTWTQQAKNPVEVTVIEMKQKGEYYGNTFIPESQLDKPIPGMNYTPRMLIAMQKSPEMQNYVIPAAEVGAVVGTAILAPEFLPITAKAVIGGALLNVAIDTGIKSYQAGQIVVPTIQEAATSALIGSTLTVGTAGALKVGNTVYKASGLATSKLAIGMRQEIQPVFEEPINIVSKAVSNTKIVQGMKAEITPVFKDAANTINPIQTVKNAAQTRITSSYMASAENMQIWQPSLTEKILMKATGTRPVIAEGLSSIPDSTIRVGGTRSLPTLNLNKAELKAPDEIITGQSQEPLSNFKWFQPQESKATTAPIVKAKVETETPAPNALIKQGTGNTTTFTEQEIFEKTKSLGNTVYYKELGRLPTRGEVIEVLQKEAAEAPQRKAFLSEFSSFKVTDAKGNIVMPQDEYNYLMATRAKAPINQPVMPQLNVFEAQEAAFDVSIGPKSSAVLVNRTAKQATSESGSFLVRSGVGSFTGPAGTQAIQTIQKQQLKPYPEQPSAPKANGMEAIGKSESKNPTLNAVNITAMQAPQQTATDREQNNSEVPSILSGVAPFPGTRKPTVEEVYQATYQSSYPVGTPKEVSDLSAPVAIREVAVNHAQNQQPLINNTPIQAPANIPFSDRITSPDSTAKQYVDNLEKSINTPTITPTTAAVQTPIDIQQPIQTPIEIQLPVQMPVNTEVSTQIFRQKQISAPIGFMNMAIPVFSYPPINDYSIDIPKSAANPFLKSSFRSQRRKYPIALPQDLIRLPKKRNIKRR